MILFSMGVILGAVGFVLLVWHAIARKPRARNLGTVDQMAERLAGLGHPPDLIDMSYVIRGQRPNEAHGKWRIVCGIICLVAGAIFMLMGWVLICSS